MDMAQLEGVARLSDYLETGAFTEDEHSAEMERYGRTAACTWCGWRCPAWVVPKAGVDLKIQCALNPSHVGTHVAPMGKIRWQQ